MCCLHERTNLPRRSVEVRDKVVRAIYNDGFGAVAIFGEMTLDDSYILEHFRALGRELIKEITAEMRSANQGDGWIDQYRSPLRLPGQKSSKRHCQLVRERIARLGPNQGAFITPDEKQFFLTPQAMIEEMSQAGRLPLAKTAPPEPPPEAVPDEDEAVYTKIRLAARGRR